MTFLRIRSSELNLSLPLASWVKGGSATLEGLLILLDEIFLRVDVSRIFFVGGFV